MANVKINAQQILKDIDKKKRRLTVFVDEDIANEFEGNCPDKKMSQVAQELFRLYNESMRKK